ncbi:hypothetical protein P278_32640 [Zhouia amylolytica AD3]|uniref:Uncharacterized protein n=1 Tax=Zhouia amylolytica AD3 TaxID=1286632 RepID=W2UIU4_9FLAO|nr:hypothetical protein P278_32640 [Zhouia amylolytica AD3]
MVWDGNVIINPGTKEETPWVRFSFTYQSPAANYLPFEKPKITL